MHTFFCPEPLVARCLRIDAHPRIEKIDKMYTAEGFPILLAPRQAQLFIMAVQLIDTIADEPVRLLQAKGSAITIPPLTLEVHV